MRVFVSAGEASGDAYAAALVRAMRRAFAQWEDEDLPAALGATCFASSIKATKHAPKSVDDLVFEDSKEFVQTIVDFEQRLKVDLVHQGEEWNKITVATIVDRVLASKPEVVEAFLSRVTPGFDFEGLGGKRSKEAGVELVADTSRWGAISFVQSLALATKVLGAYSKAKKVISKGERGLFIPIDFGAVNIRLAKHAKKKNWDVLYFMPPGSWRRDRQGKDLPKLTDAISTPFPWSAEILRKMGANAFWFGHPIKELLATTQRPPVAERETVAVLPGSREHEISEHMAVIAQAVTDLDVRLEFAVAPSVTPQDLREAWKELAPSRSGDLFTANDTYGVLSRARAAIVCSGTATLEAALCRCPMVVVYRLTKAMEREAKVLTRLGLFKQPEFISLPNILLQRPAVPELVYLDATPQRISDELLALISDDSPLRQGQLQSFEELDDLLGPSDAITKTAELALELVGRKHQ